MNISLRLTALVFKIIKLMWRLRRKKKTQKAG